MKPQSQEIGQLIDMYLSDELKLPEMQRKYVWNSTKVRDLMDSIYRDYPSGSILMWRVEQLPETRQSAIQGDKEKSIHSEKLILLDGQQRITSLASVMTGTPIRVKEGDMVVEKHIDIYFNLEHPDRLSPKIEDSGDGDVRSDDEESKSMFFQIRNKNIESLPHWISVTKLFKEGVGSILKELKINYDHPNYEKYNRRLLQLYSRKENYVYPVQILPKDINYEEATDVFVRVNSFGTRLAGADLALALVTSRWPGSMKIFEDFLTNLARSNFDIQEGFLIRCVMAVATGQSRFDRISKIPIEQVKEAWEKVQKGLELVVNFVRNNARVDTFDLLSSPSVLIPLLVYSIRNNFSFRGNENQLLHWFYAASMWGHYGRGSSETILDQDLNALNALNPAEALLKNLLQQTGRIEVKEEDLRGKSVNSSFFLMQYVAAVRRGAKDWGSGLTLSFSSVGKSHKLQYDHIFPRVKTTALLKEKYKNEGDYKTVKTLVNDMANIAFLSAKENPSKSDRQPIEYLKRVRELYGEGALSSQFIPLDENLWEMDSYEGFSAARRHLIEHAINELMKTVLKGSASDSLSVVEIVKSGENDHVEFKSSLRWDYKTNSPNSTLGYVVAKVLSSFLNSNGGTLIIGVNDRGEILGVSRDFETFESDKRNKDGFELHFMQVMKNYLGIEAMKYVQLSFETIDDKVIARINVAPSNGPMYVRHDSKAEFYIRLGNASHPLNVEETVRYVQIHWPTTAQ